MDAKPHRPLRSFKVSDENAPPHLINGKTIHQRNKSTPALSMLAQGALKAPAKRTLLADVTNNNARVQTSKDDIAAAGKAPASKTSAKSNGLARPAQRVALSAVQKENFVPTKSATAAKHEAASEPHILRKALAKHVPAVFKDVPAPIVEKEVPQPRKSKSISSLKHAQPREAVTVEEHIIVNESIELPAIEEAGKDISQEIILPPITENASEDQAATESYDDSSPEEFDPYEHHYEEDAEFEAQYVDALEVQARAMEREKNEELQREALVHPVDEQEEYSDDYDYDEEYCDANGYTTAPLRGDNTTGGITVVLAPKVTARVERELIAARNHVENTKSPQDIEDDMWDTSMVAEYGEEIFEYMRALEERMRPNPYYMDNQTEIQWSMRSVLMDWIVQVHHRFTLLPETLFLTVNYVDRFLSCKVVSLGKLQLVGATALFVAAKYEEINCPSVQEIVYMVDGGYTAEEILKAERFMLSMLQFELGWPGPMSFLRRISKADDYDLETRTLAKYFLEITMMDERFVGCTPSFTAAGAHCLARLMLKKGDWSLAHVHYSGYTYSQLRTLVATILECCEAPQKHHAAVYEKYADRRFKSASIFVANAVRAGFRLPAVARDSLPGTTQTWRRK